MNASFKRFWAVLLTILLVVNMVPTIAMANSTDDKLYSPPVVVGNKLDAHGNVIDPETTDVTQSSLPGGDLLNPDGTPAGQPSGDDSVDDPQKNQAPKEQFQVEFLHKNALGNYVRYEESGWVNPQTVTQGEGAFGPSNVPDAYPNHSFVGWDVGFGDITDNTKVYALYAEIKTYIVNIEYVFADGRTAGQSYVATVREGYDVSETITLPKVLGYTAFESAGVEGFTFFADGNDRKVTIDVKDAKRDLSYTVRYEPNGNTAYTVAHYQQNATGTGYTLKENEKTTGLTGGVAVANDKHYEGFTCVTDLSAIDKTIAADGSTVVRVEYDRNQYDVLYSLDGGIFPSGQANPDRVRFGAAIAAPKNPTRAGYTFTSWMHVDGAYAVMPAKNIVRAANWTANTNTKYTVVYWTQNADDDDYTVAATENKTGVTGAAINATAFRSASIGAQFTYQKADTGKVIAGDGSTIVNVYYTRNSYTITFLNPSKVQIYAITARYGQNIAERWKTSNGFPSGYTGYFWSNNTTTPSSGEWITMQETMIDKNQTLVAYSPGGSYTFNVYYYLQKLDASGKPIADTAQYNLHSTVSMKFTGSGLNLTYYEDFFPITGYTQFSPDFSLWTGTNKMLAFDTVTANSVYQKKLYYNLQQYTITFNNMGAISTQQRYFTQSLSDLGAAPARPLDVPADYTFDGWFRAQDFSGAKYDFSNKTMPSANLIFYAKWTPPTYTVSFDAQQGTSVASQKIAMGAMATEPKPAPTRDGYTFSGWYWDIECSRPYIFSQQVMGNTTVFAKWTQKTDIPYTVHHYKEGSTVSVAASETGKGAMNAHFAVYAKEIKGYVPDAVSKQIQLTNAAGNTFIFYYREFVSVDYSVRYLDQDNQNGEPLYPTKFVKGCTDMVVTEQREIVGGYTPDMIQKTQRLGFTASENVITFLYKKTVTQDNGYTIKFYKQLLDGSYEQDESMTSFVSGSTGEQINLKPDAIPNYAVNTVISKLTGRVLSGRALVMEIYYDRVLRTITSSAVNGTITPLGSVKLKHGDKKSYSYAPNAGYSLSALLVDGQSVPVTGATYELTDVSSDRTIEAIFEENPAVQINYDASRGGKVMPVSESVRPASGVPNGSFAMADYGYHFVDWTDAAGKSVGKLVHFAPEKNPISKLYEAGRYVANFAEDAELTIRYSAGQGGKVSLAAEAVLPQSGNPLGSTAIPDEGYHFVNWTRAGAGMVGQALSFVPAKNANGLNEEAEYVANFERNFVLTITAGSNTFIYDGAQHSESSYSASGLQAGHVLSGIAVNASAVNVGNTEVLISGTPKIMFGSADVTAHYEIMTVPGTLTIAPKPVTLTANNAGKVYGSGDPILTATAVGLVGGDALNYTLSRETGEDVGTYNISVELGANSNYDVQATGGSFAITAKPVTLTAEAARKIYGDLDPELTATADGLVEGDKLDYELGREPGEGVGSYGINVQPGQNPNYEVSTVGAALLIEPKPVTVGARNTGKVYGEADPQLEADVIGDLAFGDTLNYELSREAGENVGSYDIYVQPLENPDYTVSTETGAFEITNASFPLTIIANSASYTFDGAANSASGYEVMGLRDGHVLTGVEANATQISAGTYDVPVTGEPRIMDGNVDVTENYAITPISGQLIIAKKPVTLTADRLSKIYGEADPELSATADGLVDGDALNYELSREPGENAGSYAIRIALDENQNYDVTSVDGALVIEPKALTLTAASLSKIYGDADPELTAATADLANGDTLDALNYELSREAGENVGGYAIRIALGENPNYDVTAEDGALAIEPKPVTLTADRLSKIYGEADPELTATTADLVDGDALNYELSREAGENVGGYQINVELGENPNYAVEAVPGVLLITNASLALTITANSGSFTYDGQEQTVQGFEVSGLLEGHELRGVSAYQSNTASGSAAVKIEGTPVVMDGDVDVTQNYVVTPVDGQLVIAPRPVTLTADDLVKTYGDSDPTLSVTAENLIDGDTAAVLNYTIARESGEDAGEYGISIEAGTNRNYEIVTVNPGRLTVEPKRVTLIAADARKVYGETDPAFSAAADGLVGTDQLNYSTERAAGESVGTYAIAVIPGENPNYDVQVEGSQLQITPKPIVVSAKSAGKLYGEEDPELEADVEGLEGGDALNYALSRAAGENTGSYVIEVVPGENPNYAIETRAGEFVISNASIPVWIRATGDRVTYDSQAHSAQGYEVTGLRDGHVLRGVSAEVTGTDAGSYEMNVSGTPVIMDGNVDVTENYLIGTVAGTLVIDRKPASVSVNSTDKVYGESDPELTAVVEGLEGQDSLNYTLSREAGENVGRYAIRAELGGNPNYEVSASEGTLVIEPKFVTLTAASLSKIYGEADPELTASADGLVDGDALNYELSRVPGEDAAGYAIRVTLGENPNYEVSAEGGTLVIEPKLATLTAASLSKIYGEADPTLSANADGLVDGDALNYELSRELGENVGRYAIRIALGENPNYDVTAEDGALVIEPKALTLTAASLSKIYGDADPELTAATTDLANGDTLDALNYELSREAGENVGGYAIRIALGENPNYDVTAEDGALAIEPKPVTLAVDDLAKTYGDADPNPSVIIEGLVGQDALVYDLERESGEDVGNYPIIPKALEGANPNYVVNTRPGTLQIRPASFELIITANSGEFGYDGAEHTVSGYEVSGLRQGHTLSGVTASATARNAGETEVTITGTPVIRDGNTDVTLNYVPVNHSGSLRITPRELSIAANAQTKLYGAADPEFTATMTGAIAGDTVSYTLGRAAGDDVGSYVISVQAGDNPNYQLTTQNGMLTILGRVSYNANGGTGSLPQDNREYQSGEAARLMFSPAPSMADAQFLGWSEDQNALRPSYTSGGVSSMSMGARSITLYAVYASNADVQLTAGRVEYYYDGVLNAELTRELSQLPVNSRVNVYPEALRGGYRFQRADNFPMTVSETAAQNVIRVYYQKLDPSTSIMDVSIPLGAGTASLNVGDSIE